MPREDHLDGELRISQNIRRLRCSNKARLLQYRLPFYGSMSSITLWLTSREALQRATRNSKPGTRNYSTRRAQFGWLASLVKQLRKNSTIWSCNVWQRGPQRRAPVSCFTQLRKPRKCNTAGSCNNCCRNSSRRRGKKNNSNPLPDSHASVRRSNFNTRRSAETSSSVGKS